MKTVTCSLPNASTHISGVAFDRLDDDRVQATVPDEQAALFDGIAGYEVVEAEADAHVKSAGKGGKRAAKDAGDAP